MERGRSLTDTRCNSTPFRRGTGVVESVNKCTTLSPAYEDFLIKISFRILFDPNKSWLRSRVEDG